MKILLAFLATAALAAPVLAQDMAPATDLPVCSKEVRDRCVQGPAAQRREAQEFKDGGRDNSAMMTPKQAAAGMAKPR
ncbi:MAG: hypothetical protein ACK4MT_09000 [Thermaurantiacus tibetensis]|nr:hypothetical protein [Thermaurantiacus tibetensis]